MKNKPIILAFIFSLLLHGTVLLINLPSNAPASFGDKIGKFSVSLGELEPSPLSPLPFIPSEAEGLGEGNKRGEGFRNLGDSGTDKTAGGELQNSYLKEIRKRIQEAKKYPELARIKNLEGSPKVEFTILENGQLNKLKLLQPSKFKILDDEALATVNRASPFPAIPKSLGTPAVKIALALIFKLGE